MKGKPEGKPSGNHPFDMVCAKTKIDHRLTKPFKPQTNGMVERFNRRIAEAIGRENKRGSGHRLFASHDDRNAFLNQFVHDYNHTRLKCLGYVAPLEALANLAEHNTKAGIQSSAGSIIIGGLRQSALICRFHLTSSGAKPRNTWPMRAWPGPSERRIFSARR